MHTISPISDVMVGAIDAIIDHKTKPVGSLGALEGLARQVARIQQSTKPKLCQPTMLVFAGDHGVTAQGVSPYPQEVTPQMVANFIHGGAAINVFCRQHQISLKVVNAGVKYPLEESSSLINTPVMLGTEDFSLTQAMSSEQCQAAMQLGKTCCDKALDQGCNVIGFGEMGIGNTTSASAIMAALLALSPELCVGKGTGMDDAGVVHKQSVVEQALSLHQLQIDNPLRVLECVGGLEIAGIVGGMLQASKRGVLVLVDGFIATAAALVAVRIAPACRDYMVFCHGSAEQGHRRMLEALDAQPLLDLGLRLGEGSGVAIAYPLICSAVAFFNEMASFESAGVSASEPT